MALELPDPTLKYRFVVKIQGAAIGWFTECSGLTMERAVHPQAEGGINNYVHQLPGSVTCSKITLKRGLADNALWNWFQAGLYDGNVERRNVTIALLNPDGAEVRRWDMPQAYPVRWGGIDFQADSNQAGVETLEIAAGGGAAQAVVQRAFDDESASLGNQPATLPAAKVDLSDLADKIYALLKQELWVERERLGRK